jgi:serpin B
MGIAFQDRANFTGMTSTPVNINEVKHKTFVEVNEEGTEAAAVTSVGIRATSAMPVDEPFNMVVDRPFFVAIRDNQTGTLLFMGSIVEPQQ